MPERLISDEDLERDLIRMLLWNKEWCRACADLVSDEEFKPLSGQTTVLWIVAQLGLAFYRKHRVPVDSNIVAELKTWFRGSGTAAERQKEWADALRRLKADYDPARAEMLISYVREFKHRQRRRNALNTLVDLNNQHQLTDEKWVSIMRGAMEEDGGIHISDLQDHLEDRQQRRIHHSHRRTPILMIDPLDIMVKSIARGQVGLWLGYYKMGKSMALINNAVAFLAQGFNVLYFSLEDSLEDVEDRLDANITQTITTDLGFEHEEVLTRFSRFQDKFKAGFRIIDGTPEGGLTIQQIESIYDRQKNEGFHADAVLIDYDDQIRPTIKRQDRRFEFADIYRDLTRFAAKHDVYLWTAAQANRAAEGQAIVSGKYTAEDISKIRKVTMAIGIGQGEWGEDSRALYVAAHRTDQSHGLCTIWSSPEKGTFYDREQTLEELERRRKTYVPR